MKIYLRKKICLIALLLVCAISAEAGPTENSSTTMKPGSKDLKEVIKNAREANKAKKDCLKACPANYDPICAHDPANPTFKPRSFGNQCVLDTHNCEMGTSKLKNLNYFTMF